MFKLHYLPTQKITLKTKVIISRNFNLDKRWHSVARVKWRSVDIAPRKENIDLLFIVLQLDVSVFFSLINFLEISLFTRFWYFINIDMK